MKLLAILLLLLAHAALGQFRLLQLPQPSAIGKPELLNYGTFNPYVGEVYHPTDLFLRRNIDGSRFVTVSDVGSLLVFGGGQLLTRAMCRVVGAKTGSIIKQAIGRQETPVCTAFSPNSQYLLVGTVEGTALLFDLSVSVDQDNPIAAAMGPPARYTLTGHRGSIVAVAFSGDGQLLLTGSSDSTLRFWQLSDGKLLRSLPVGSGVTDFCFSPDGNHLIVGTEKGTILLLNATTGKVIRSMSGHTGQVRSVSVHSTGEILSGGEDGTIRTWDLATGAARQVITWHNGPVKQVTYLGDKLFFISVGTEKTGTAICLWEMNDNEPIQTLSQSGLPYVSNVSTVNGIQSFIILARPSNLYTLYQFKP